MPKNDNSVWDKWFDSLDDFTDDFMDERNQPEAQVREDLF
jgi:virulence-associated protein VagC